MPLKNGGHMKRIKYKVISGEMNVVIHAGATITPVEIALLAVSNTMVKNLGSLISVSGGSYVGDCEHYVSTEIVCKKLGTWKGAINQ
jgi:hypothetical protein